MFLTVAPSRICHRGASISSSWQHAQISVTSSERYLSGGRRRRDPPMPALTNPVEQAIAAAQKRGDLSNLSGAGKPLTTKDNNSNNHHRIPGMSTSELLSKKAEFEMRRAVQSGELEHLNGEKLEYKGTNIVSTSLSSSGGSSMSGGKQPSGTDVMGRYILEQAQPKAKDLK